LADLFGTVIDLVLVFILSVYLAANGTRIAHWLKTETPTGTTRYRAQLLVAVVSRVVGGYIRGVLLLALLIGVLVGAGLAVLGVPYAVLLGVLAFFMEFIPVLGVFISGAAAVVIAIVHFQEVLRPLLVLAYFIIVHVIEGDVIGPRIMGKAVGIHPATGLIALVAGTELFGIWGALFAAPLAGLLQAVVTAAWLEFRGGKPHEILQAMTEEASQQLEQRAGLA
jgi:predicted PurR-regulated permease PerM